MPETRVRSWTELTEQLYEGSWQEELRRFRSTFAFRGMSRAHYNLSTSLSRLGGSTKDIEEHMLRAFRKYAHRESLPGDSLWNWLALAQHHGLPTRLLDWTYSPFVAMHFAAGQPTHFDVDGVIWCVNFSLTNTLLPERLQHLLAREGGDVFTADMLAQAATTLREFDRLSDDAFVVFFEPPSLDERIVNQYALFSLLSSPEVSLDDWLADHSDACRRIVIPAELKPEVRDKLDQANITERVLYPGLDGLSMWLKRYYTPRSR